MTTPKFTPKNEQERRLLSEHTANQAKAEKAASAFKESQLSKSIEEAERGLYEGLDSADKASLRGASIYIPPGGWYKNVDSK